MRRHIPFYENTDDTHCFQAVLRMILKYYRPDEDYTWQQLDKLTAKVEGLWTWPTAGMLWLHNNGFEVRNVETFDYQKFIEAGGDYLIELFGAKVGREQIAHSKLSQEIDHARQLIEAGLAQSRTPELVELKYCLNENYLLICNVNSRALNSKHGYAGHFVLLTGYTDSGFILHDPGPPGLANREVAFADFERAWAYPDELAKNYIAMRKKD